MREVIVSILIILGCFLQLIAAIGILKFPNLLIRLHASSKSSTLGIGFVLIALGIWRGDWITYILVILAIFFVFFSSPTILYLFAQSEKNEN